MPNITTTPTGKGILYVNDPSECPFGRLKFDFGLVCECTGKECTVFNYGNIWECPLHQRKTVLVVSNLGVRK